MPRRKAQTRSNGDRGHHTVSSNNSWSRIATVAACLLFIFQLLYILFQLREIHNLRGELENQNLHEQLNPPDSFMMRAKEVYQSTNYWREELLSKLYNNVTDEEFDKATIWRGYADPFGPARSCAALDLPTQPIHDLLILLQKLQLSMDSVVWNDEMRRKYVTLHAFHSTGIEGNTLGLPATSRVVNRQGLFAGFKDHLLDPVLNQSVWVVRNIVSVYDALRPLTIPLSTFRLELDGASLHSLNSGLLRDSPPINTGGRPKHPKTGFRSHEVGVGGRRVLLPQALEVPNLMEEYLERVARQRDALRNITDGFDRIHKGLQIACDAHTTFVHIHPFGDGNGRLARLLSGVILQDVGLPAPMFTRSQRHAYMNAVSKATIDTNYMEVCSMHTAAVVRSAKAILSIAAGETILHEYCNANDWCTR